MREKNSRTARKSSTQHLLQRAASEENLYSQRHSLIGEAIISGSVASETVKYFFLLDGWNVGRVWELGGLWNEISWRRKPEIERLNLCILEQNEKLWLYRVEEAVLMAEVKPNAQTVEAMGKAPSETIGQVVLKRLITAEQAIDLLCKAEGFVKQ